MRPSPVLTDEASLAPAVADLGQRTTTNHVITQRDSPPDALRHHHTQPFLRLFGHDGGTVGPLIQYLHTTVHTDDESVLAATGGRFRASPQRPESMAPGRSAASTTGPNCSRPRRRWAT